ncbi:hypothetical protein ACFPN7_23970 [Amycolatopsis halotolerans]|uniref:hypothetical protein n=1 Tax=Amycolatopsis halotolerans TaxID=330083 RepID=UPI003611EA71
MTLVKAPRQVCRGAFVVSAPDELPCGRTEVISMGSSQLRAAAATVCGVLSGRPAWSRVVVVREGLLEGI